MNTLRASVQDYLAMRRGLGFKLHDAGVGLLKFVSFMEYKHASHITRNLLSIGRRNQNLLGPRSGPDD